MNLATILLLIIALVVAIKVILFLFQPGAFTLTIKETTSLISITLLAVFMVIYASPLQARELCEGNFVRGEFLLLLNEGASIDDIKSELEKYNLNVVEHFDPTNIFLLLANVSCERTKNIINDLNGFGYPIAAIALTWLLEEIQ